MAAKLKRKTQSLKPDQPTQAPPTTPAPQAQPAKGERKRKVFLVDDHPIVRERLGELIAQETDLEVCGEAEEANTALKMIGALQPDIAIVDITLKDTYGIELVKNLKEREGHIPVLVLSMHEASMYGERAIRAGARGYLNKQEASKKVISAIRTILAGEIFVSDQMKSAMLQKMAGGGHRAGGAGLGSSSWNPSWPNRHLHHTIAARAEQLVRLPDLVEREPVRHQRCRIEPPRADHVDQPPHPLLAARAERRDDPVVAQAGRE